MVSGTYILRVPASALTGSFVWSKKFFVAPLGLMAMVPGKICRKDLNIRMSYCMVQICKPSLLLLYLKHHKGNGQWTWRLPFLEVRSLRLWMGCDTWSTVRMEAKLAVSAARPTTSSQ